MKPASTNQARHPRPSFVSDQMSDIRQLKIKTGSVKRLYKELAMYEREQIEHEQKLLDLKDAGSEPHKMKHQENVVAEASAVVPDTRARLETAAQELDSLIANSKEVPELSTARDVLRLAALALEPDPTDP